MASFPLSFIDRKLLALNAVQHFDPPFPDVPDIYAGFLGNLASSYTNGEVQMPTRHFHVTVGPANELFDHVIFQEILREEFPESTIVVDHFTVQSGVYGMFYLTHIREFHHDNATICTIRRNPTAHTAWIPVKREFRYQFDYREWLGSRWEWWLIEIGWPSTVPPCNLVTVYADGYQYWVKEQNHRCVTSYLLTAIFFSSIHATPVVYPIQKIYYKSAGIIYLTIIHPDQFEFYPFLPSAVILLICLYCMPPFFRLILFICLCCYCQTISYFTLYTNV